MNESKLISSGNKSTVEYGGISRMELLNKLKMAGVLLNEFSNILFSSKLFKTSSEKRSITIIEISLKDLGFPVGATLSEIRERTKEYGLSDCPLEVGPYLRLKYVNQEEVLEDSLERKNHTPPGCLTIFSKPLLNDDEFPKGFYLRKMDGKLWIRGYRCTMDFVWDPNDKFIFKIN